MLVPAVGVRRHRAARLRLLLPLLGTCVWLVVPRRAERGVVTGRGSAWEEEAACRELDEGTGAMTGAGAYGIACPEAACAVWWDVLAMAMGCAGG